MTDTSRRSLLRGFVTAGAAGLLPHAVTHSFAADAKKAFNRSAARQQLIAYFSVNAAKLLRPPEGWLKYPSIAPSLPGKAYSAQLWDWDTLWTSRGLFRLANLTGNRDLHGQISDHVKGSLLNFLDHQSADGRIPFLMTADDEVPRLSKGNVPDYANQAKPVLSQLALLASEETGSAQWVAPVFDRLLRFYDSWARHNQHSSGLFVWGDDVSIGNDNDPTTFGRPFFSSANLLLNCLFYQDLKAAETLAKQLGRKEQMDIAQRRDALGSAIQRECWDPRDAFYYTADVQCKDRRSELIPGVPQGMSMSWSTLPLRVQVFTGFLPLWCGLATSEQAKLLVQRNYIADDRLRSNYGVRSLSRLETMYSMARSGNPSNWLGPIWIIVNYLAWQGLDAYGFSGLANDLADKTIDLLATGFARDGSLNEYYHPDTGASLSHEGFMDWNLLVLEML